MSQPQQKNGELFFTGYVKCDGEIHTESCIFSNFTKHVQKKKKQDVGLPGFPFFVFLIPACAMVAFKRNFHESSPLLRHMATHRVLHIKVPVVNDAYPPLPLTELFFGSTNFFLLHSSLVRVDFCIVKET